MHLGREGRNVFKGKGWEGKLHCTKGMERKRRLY